MPHHAHEGMIKCFQARYFLVPRERLNKLIIGALAYAQQKYGMKICYPVCLTNHAHWLYVPDSASQARDFFRLAHSQISREAGRVAGWTGGIFKERYKSTVVTEEPEAQVQRLKYLMANGVKEGLVKLPEQWPGVSGIKACLDGSMSMEGVWVDRTAYDAACRKYRRRVKGRQLLRRLGRRVIGRLTKPRERDFEQPITLNLSPIPAWEGLSGEQIKTNFRQLREEILSEHQEARARVRPDWKRRLCDPDQRGFRPEKTKKGKRPKFHAASTEVWLLYVKNWENWLTQYERASSRLRQGVLEAWRQFPDDCFLPTSLVPSDSLQRFSKPPP